MIWLMYHAYSLVTDLEGSTRGIQLCRGALVVAEILSKALIYLMVSS